MKYVNRVELIGNLTADPIRGDGTAADMSRFIVATNRAWKDKKGEAHSLAEYHRVIAWGDLAQHAMEILGKGKLVYIDGYLRTRSFGPEEEKQHQTEIVCETLIVLSKREE